MMFKAPLVVFAAAVALLTPSLASAKPDAVWGQDGRSAAKNGQSPFAGPSQLDVVWNSTFVTDVGTSQAVWSSGFGSGGGVAAAIFTDISGDKTIYAIDALTGARTWNKILGTEFVGTPALDDSGVLYVYRDVKRAVEAYHLMGFKRLWSTPTNGSEGSSITYDDDSVYLVDGGLLSIAKSDGSIRWSVGDETHFSIGSPAVSSQSVYYTTTSGTLVSANKATGKMQWQWTDPKINGATTPVVVSMGVGTPIVVIAADADPTSGHKGYLIAVNAILGTTVWELPTSGLLSASPAIGCVGTIYIGHNVDDDGTSHFMAVNPANGQSLWEYKWDKNFDASASVDSRGVVWVTDVEGTLFGFQGRTGEVLHQATFSPPCLKKSACTPPTRVTIGPEFLMLGINGALLGIGFPPEMGTLGPFITCPTSGSGPASNAAVAIWVTICVVGLAGVGGWFVYRRWKSGKGFFTSSGRGAVGGATSSQYSSLSGATSGGSYQASSI